MSLLRLASGNLVRNRLRIVLTGLGIAITLLAFVLIRTILEAWTVGADYASKDRITTRNKVTFIVPLPKNYIQVVRDVPGVKEATFMNWFGGKDPKHEKEFFATLAVDEKSFLSVYDELLLQPEQKEAWLQDRKGLIVGDVLAKKFGWKVGQTVTLTSELFAGDWNFKISGIYQATQKSIDRTTIYFHWSYLNESLKEERQRDRIGWVVSRLTDPTRSAQVSKNIDAVFDEKEMGTLTMSERAFNTSFLGMFSAILSALNVVSWVILLIMMLILGNTIAMNTRERTKEIATLRAIGFLPRHIAISILGEALLLGVFGGMLGSALSYPLINFGVGRFIEENVGGIFPYFRTSWFSFALSMGLSVLLALLAAIVPAYRASQQNVVQGLRKIA